MLQDRNSDQNSDPKEKREERSKLRLEKQKGERRERTRRRRKNVCWGGQEKPEKFLLNGGFSLCSLFPPPSFSPLPPIFWFFFLLFFPFHHPLPLKNNMCWGKNRKNLGENLLDGGFFCSVFPLSSLTSSSFLFFFLLFFPFHYPWVFCCFPAQNFII